MRRTNVFNHFGREMHTTNFMWGVVAVAAGTALSVGLKKLVEHAMQNNATGENKEPDDFGELFNEYSHQPEEEMVNFIFGTGGGPIEDEDKQKKQREWDELMFWGKSSTPRDEMDTAVHIPSEEERCHE